MDVDKIFFTKKGLIEYMHFGSEIFVNANMLSSDPRLPVLLQPSYNFGTSIKREIKNDKKYSY